MKWRKPLTVNPKVIETLSKVTNAKAFRSVVFYILIVLISISYCFIASISNLNSYLKFSAYAIILPGAALLAFCLCMRQNGRRTQQTQSKYPIKTYHDHRTLSTESTKGKREVVACWHYRHDAYEDIKETLVSAKNHIFASGMGLSTILPILNNQVVIKAIALNMEKNQQFQLTLITIELEKLLEMKERHLLFTDQEDLKGHLKASKRKLIEFSKTLDAEVAPKVPRPLVSFYTYPDAIHPHHFLLMCDNCIYVGSYLSHKLGSESYLIKLQNCEDGLFYLFLKEIMFLQQAPKALNINISD